MTADICKQSMMKQICRWQPGLSVSSLATVLPNKILIWATMLVSSDRHLFALKPCPCPGNQGKAAERFPRLLCPYKVMEGQRRKPKTQHIPPLFFFIFHFFVFTFTYICMHRLGHLPSPSTSGQNLFHPLVLRFC
jgi:hypothetical protein